MNEVQAVKFWNSIQQGEIIQVIPDNGVSQGCEVTKPTYSSAVCDQLDLPFLTVPRISYSYDGSPTGTYNPPKSDSDRVVEFLRNLADSIENSSSVKL